MAGAESDVSLQEYTLTEQRECGAYAPFSVRDGNYSGSRLPGNGKRRASKDRPEGFKQRAALLAHGGEVTAKGAEGRDPLGTAEGARNLLLDLDHAQVALGQVIGERDGQIIQKP